MLILDFQKSIMALPSNPFQPILDFIPEPLQNKYVLTAIIFFSWMLIFDKHDIRTQMSLHKTLTRMEADKEYYKNKIVDSRLAKKDLHENLEKFAREHYYMSKNNEDVFIIETKE